MARQQAASQKCHLSRHRGNVCPPQDHRFSLTPGPTEHPPNPLTALKSAFKSNIYLSEHISKLAKKTFELSLLPSP